MGRLHDRVNPRPAQPGEDTVSLINYESAEETRRKELDKERKRLSQSVQSAKDKAKEYQAQIHGRTVELTKAIDKRLLSVLGEVGYNADTLREQTGAALGARGASRSSLMEIAAADISKKELTAFGKAEDIAGENKEAAYAFEEKTNEGIKRMDAQLETQESFINFLTNATMDQMSQKFQEVTDYTEYINQLSLDAQTTEALMGGLEGVFQGVGAMMTGFDWGEEIGAEKPPPPGEDWSSYLYRQ